jgi:hypothetical protein
MNPTETYGLTLIYTDGSHEHFKFPPHIEKAKLASVVEKLLSSSVLSLELEDRLLVIPTVNIRNAEISPVPEKLPEVVLRNVRRVGSIP